MLIMRLSCIHSTKVIVIYEIICHNYLIAVQPETLIASETKTDRDESITGLIVNWRICGVKGNIRRTA